jgi:thiosulfate/3-mercaptopyruvate sulfurtransferase
VRGKLQRNRITLHDLEIDVYVFRHLRFLRLNIPQKSDGRMNAQPALSRSFIFRVSLFTVIAAAVALAQDLALREDPLPPGSNQLIQAEELAQALKGARKPVVLYVGPKSIYAQAHIPGAENIGPVVRPEGMEKLRARLTSLAKDSPVVIYCGCCPWDHCPNIRPAYAELKKARFTNVRVLYLENSFGANWKDKGLPVATGE